MDNHIILSDEVCLKLGSWAYTEWADACDRLDAILREEDDGTEDWAAFHEHRLASATTARDRARAWLDEVTVQTRPVLRRVWSLNQQP